MKLSLYERNQAAERGLVALAPSEKQSGGLRWMVRDAAILSPFAPVHRFHGHFPLLKQEKGAKFVVLMSFTTVDEVHGVRAAPNQPSFPLLRLTGWSQPRSCAMCSHPQHFRGDIS
jgi:hypothetical protein